MKSWMRRPIGLSAKALTTAVSSPKQRLRPRATLYSPPPSRAWKLRAVVTRPSPGSRRSMISPSETRSKRQLALGLMFKGMALPLFDRYGFGALCAMWTDGRSPAVNGAVELAGDGKKGALVGVVRGERLVDVDAETGLVARVERAVVERVGMREDAVRLVAVAH